MTDTSPTVTPTPTKRRRRWSLQTRLMVTITGIVALIIVMLGIATSTIIGQVLQDGLDARLQTTAQDTGRTLLGMQFRPGQQTDPVTAVDVLEQGRQQDGTILVVQGLSGQTSGAVVGEGGDVSELTSTQISGIVEDVTGEGAGPGINTINVEDLGEYRVLTYGAQDYSALVGVPLSEIQGTITQIFTVVALVTTGGLLLLSAAIAVVISRGLRPLRSVADTAARVAALPMAEGDVRITERVPDAETDEHTEIGRVGHALNTLLDHVDTSLEARQRNEERMRRFVADASHELRTPLASIRGYSELSLRALQHSSAKVAAETTEASLDRIQAQSLRMSALVEDLLLLARLDEGRELVYGSVDLSRLAIEAVGDAQAAGQDHTWELDVDAEPVVVAGDGPRLHQVVANLLANARIHTPAETTVTVSVVREDGDAVLRVHDDGPGIDPGVADELFERFSRADTSRARQTGGTGLGLSIAQAIAHAHDGTLRVTSEPGDTTFELRVPSVRPSVPVEPAAQ